jgi:formimidoylglutamate deiminase
MKWLAQQAWLPGQTHGAWVADVLLEADASGCWSAITPSPTPQQAQGASAVGWVIPGMVNAHSHAFQRAMAGLAEHSQRAGDDFWSWREHMYRIALAVQPDQIEAIATWLYAELLDAGYTQVCEFHYLHCAPDGSAYADPGEMTWALVRAAQTVGIGLTVLPTLYMHQGFGQPGLSDMQRRFASTPASVLALREAVNALARRSAQGTSPLSAPLNAGVALHSLRAVDAVALWEVAAGVTDGPIHIHVAEQMKEVNDCLKHQGQRPIEWLLDHAPVDARWNLVHATHATADEIRGLVQRDASVVICPTTEANLGDGFFEFPQALAQGLRWSIGTDSHINRNGLEELRWLEYGQRLRGQRRNVALDGQLGLGSSAAVLLDNAWRGGVAATGLPLGGLALGQRADWLELDPDSDALVGIPLPQVLDALVFSSPSPSWRRRVVAGKEVLSTKQMYRHKFLAAMQAIL